jgi:trk system potassium uptake protein TrkH
MILLLTESQRLPLDQALWVSVFHAVSAFCNAGFGLRPDNLMADRANAGIVLPISLLIILGGLGFVVLAELARWVAASPAAAAGVAQPAHQGGA